MPPARGVPVRRTAHRFFILVALLVLVTAWPSTALAQYRRRGPVVFVSHAYFYDPFWGPWDGFQYPYPYPYGYYPRRYDPGASLRVMVKPNKAEVYVDGYYAGIVDDFDGVFQRLPATPGQHEITLDLDGYRTVHQKI